jgi:hypothetical protein
VKQWSVWKELPARECPPPKKSPSSQHSRTKEEEEEEEATAERGQEFVETRGNSHLLWKVVGRALEGAALNHRENRQ